MMLSLVQSKIQSWDEAAATLAGWRIVGQQVVFTNGCFDLIHPGHLQYLMEARDQGQRLLIGLNSDASVGRLKGTHRPIMSEEARALLLASLAYVDLVVLFEEDTPLNLIQHLRPDVLVKGGDYQIDQIVGAREVQSWGGEVRVLPFVPGHSSTAIETKIKEQS